jgi:hypothetical protein
MPVLFEDTVRPYQLPQNSPAQLYLSQYGLTSNQPIYVTPGFGGSGSGQLPPIQTASAHYDITVTSYVDQAASEPTAVEQ